MNNIELTCSICGSTSTFSRFDTIIVHNWHLATTYSCFGFTETWVRGESWGLKVKGPNLFKKCLIICQHCRIICHIVMINEWNVSLTHWCHGIMGKGCRTNLPPWLPSKQIPHNPQMEQVDDFVTSIYQHAHLLGGTQVSRNHGWGLMERSTRRALALQVVLFCPNLWKLPNNMLKIAY